jgi:hypothetical protein
MTERFEYEDLKPGVKLGHPDVDYTCTVTEVLSNQMFKVSWSLIEYHNDVYADRAHTFKEFKRAGWFLLTIPQDVV